MQAVIREAEVRLNGAGRLLIRKSGTEPLIRVMAECEDEALLAAAGRRHRRGGGGRGLRRAAGASRAPAADRAGNAPAQPSALQLPKPVSAPTAMPGCAKPS